MLCQVKPRGDIISIHICDNGVGISEEKLADIWSYTYSTSVAAAGSSRKLGEEQALSGCGVGLPLSRLNAQYFGGDLEVESVEGVGTKVCLRLDRSQFRRENLGQLESNDSNVDVPIDEMGSLDEFLDWQAAVLFHENLDDADEELV